MTIPENTTLPLRAQRGPRSKKYERHDMSDTTAYSAWKNMWARCKGYQKKQDGGYKDRGITVCEERATFLKFFQDMGPPPDGLSLDRVNNDLGYYKENCRWATRSQQQLNQRPIRRNNKSGVKGVCWDSRKGKWLVTYRSKFYGYADSIEVATQIRRLAEENNNAK